MPPEEICWGGVGSEFNQYQRPEPERHPLCEGLTVRRAETMRRVRGQQLGGGSTAEEPMRAERRLGLKIHRSFSIRLHTAEKNRGGRSSMI